MKLRLLAFAALSVITFSCSKNGSDVQQSSITGNYKFVSISAETESEMKYSENGIQFRDVTTSQYTSVDNKGTMKIAPDVMETVGIGYTISSTATLKSYEDGELIYTFDSPFNYTLPSSSSTTKYKQVSADSITYEGTSFLGGPSQTSGGGSKFYVDGNKLIFKGTSSKVSTQNLEGIIVTRTDKVIGTSIFEKQ
jgi:hypothetical protein